MVAIFHEQYTNTASQFYSIIFYQIQGCSCISPTLFRFTDTEIIYVAHFFVILPFVKNTNISDSFSAIRFYNRHREIVFRL